MTDDQQTNDDAPEAPAGFVPEREVADLRKNLAIVQRKLKQASSTPNTAALMDDPEFVRGVFDHHGVPYGDDGKFKLPETMKDASRMEEEFRSRLAKAQEQWKAKDLAPYAERAQKLESELQDMRATTLRQKLESSGRRAGIVDDKFKPLPFSTKKNFAPIHAAADLFQWDDEARDHVLHDGGEIVYGNKGPVTADAYWDYFKESAPKEVQLEWFGDQRQRSSGFRSNGTNGRNAYTLTAEEARDTSKFRAAKAAAKSAGRDVVII